MFSHQLCFGFFICKTRTGPSRKLQCALEVTFGEYPSHRRPVINGNCYIHPDFQDPVRLHLYFKVKLQRVLIKQINILHLTFVNNLNVIVIEKKVDSNDCSRFLIWAGALHCNKGATDKVGCPEPPPQACHQMDVVDFGQLSVQALNQ